MITPLVLIGLVAASWALRPESRKLAAPEPAAASGRSSTGKTSAPVPA